MEQLPLVDAVMVPVGGGGLIAGIAIAIKHLKPDTEIYVNITGYLLRNDVFIVVVYFK